ncbi:MAG: A24 family peptidase [Eubacteriales bacterium]|nr:A24 family peptidase [Eubacteriales bacterium]
MHMLVAGVILTAAAYGDWREHRVANKWIILGWCLGILFRVWEGGIQALCIGFVALAVPLIAGWPLYHMGGIGAGDIKLCSVISVLCGMHFLGKVLVIMSVIAGIVSFVQLWRKAELRQRCVSLLVYLLNRRYIQEKYYQPDLKERGRVIPLAPVTWIAYILVLLGQKGGI